MLWFWKGREMNNMWLTYLQVFLVGGTICLIGQILILKTKMTSARILVLFLIAGVILEALDLYDPLVEFGKAGATVPIVGFGRTLAKGVINFWIKILLEFLFGYNIDFIRCIFFFCCLFFVNFIVFVFFAISFSCFHVQLEYFAK